MFNYLLVFKIFFIKFLLLVKIPNLFYFSLFNPVMNHLLLAQLYSRGYYICSLHQNLSFECSQTLIILYLQIFQLFFFQRENCKILDQLRFRFKIKSLLQFYHLNSYLQMIFFCRNWNFRELTIYYHSVLFKISKSLFDWLCSVSIITKAIYQLQRNRVAFIINYIQL